MQDGGASSPLWTKFRTSGFHLPVLPSIFPLILATCGRWEAISGISFLHWSTLFFCFLSIAFRICTFRFMLEKAEFCNKWRMWGGAWYVVCALVSILFIFTPPPVPLFPMQWWSYLNVDNPRYGCWPAYIIPSMDIRFKVAEIQM